MKELKNVSYALLGSFASIPMQLLGGVLVARSLGPELFGSYSFALTFSYIFSCFAEGGLSILATRELARQKDKATAYLTSLILIKMFLTITFFSVMIVSSILWDVDGDKISVLIIVGVGNFLSSLCFLLVGIARAHEKMKIEGLMNFIQSISFVLFLIIFLYFYKSDDLLVVATCFMFSYLLSSFVGVISLKNYLFSGFVVDLYLISTLSKEALTVAVGWIILLTYTRVGVVVLEAGSNEQEVGYFNAALRLSLNLGVLPYILAGAWMPMLSRAAYADRETYIRGATTLMKYLLIGGLLLAVPLSLAANGVVNLFYGREFDAAALPFALLMVSMFFFFISFGPKTFMESANRQSGWGIATCTGLVVNVVVTAWLAPTLGATGASLGLLAANAIIALISFGFCASLVPWQPMMGRMSKIVFGGVLMALLTWVLLPLSWFIAGLGGGSFFLGYLLVINEIRVAEIRKIFSREVVEGEF